MFELPLHLLVNVLVNALILPFIRFANWRLIRGVGELQILTRVSYAMLVIVPLLAGTWPAVKVIINQHNQAIQEAAEALRKSHIDFQELLSEITPLIPALMGGNANTESALDADSNTGKNASIPSIQVS